MAISTTITKKFFDLKMGDLEERGQFWEFKEFKKHWIKQLDYLVFHPDELPLNMIFLVGNKPHIYTVSRIGIIQRKHIPHRYLSAISTKSAYALKCVPTIEEVAKYNGIQVWNPEEPK